ncbi:precorrin-6A synthase (deacetylating) [Pseudomonas sp. FW306-02-F02-AA]|uniref:Precorrin 6A synthase n=1 Tax=Pseudomonas fluorescens TaxID=294 RepID=A0A0N9WPL7_PSEFL|nr:MULTISPECIES: precorrin-6A synthase (deacetylating) [Pseudomonas]ALI04688.1 precorrin 6A synthase [Pseudomonas fluorescens]PMZ00580.1 precorrin-6A synthase (deacetylating) [Pseudomonas sp. FW306-02-F02-AB]PMZ10977.1 precorrin-6A synthase (deacetylating) [Pseudomonas sp. FW306-02-H06C]PMZ16932.1 precorrin-6A synthase (deacetylating) [Pseudomonas sp. FW306-02-F02-AA]PMZ23177.1 precorrin-6A synthase (deacetylating) [Pseudomonas sp. FW306-02-F08-AA]
MKQLLVIGIGAGNPEYITMQAVNALNRVDVFFLMDKGQSKDKLIDLRREICERYITDPAYRFVEADSPERVRGDVDYSASVVDLNRDKQQIFERLINEEMTDDECAAFLVWGDPALYDSTLRILQAILESGRCTFTFEVIPGISSVQALAAQHKVPLNRIGRSIEITTGRRLAAGQVSDADSLVVMLDAEDSYLQVADQEQQIYWGAYLGTPDEILISGKLKDVAQEITRVRKAARLANGWIMDTYLLRKPESPE